MVTASPAQSPAAEPRRWPGGAVLPPRDLLRAGKESLLQGGGAPRLLRLFAGSPSAGWEGSGFWRWSFWLGFRFPAKLLAPWLGSVCQPEVLPRSHQLPRTGCHPPSPSAAGSGDTFIPRCTSAPAADPPSFSPSAVEVFSADKN